MPRRLIMIQLRKYFLVFFGVMLLIIWLRHYKDLSKQDASSMKPRFMAKIREESSEKSLEENEFDMSKIFGRLERRMKTPKGNNELDEQFRFIPTEITSSKGKPARYYVNSRKCKMPYADPFSQQVLEIYRPNKLKVCTNESHLFELNYDINAGSYKLQVKKNVLRKLRPNMNGRYKCNYREVTRGTNSSGDQYSVVHRRVYFRNSCTLPQNVSGIIVECHELQRAAVLLQQDAFHLVQVFNKSVRPETKPVDRHPSVLVIGLASMSRMNFRRTMPKTMEFVNQDGWFEMEGYNKVGDNTIENLIPVLAGYTRAQLLKLSTGWAINRTNCLDRLPWIWRDYENAGYATALAEDNLASMFSTSLGGFLEKPTNHYLRPLLLGINKAMRFYERFGNRYCFGRRLRVAYVFDFCQQFTQRYVKELNQPAFGFFWSSTFTQDFYYGASSLDGKLEEYFQTWETQSLFEKSIVILFSDHGARHGDLMELPDSFLEERLPMLHIYLPPWFRNTYPQYAQALHINRNRLCSNFDLHNTLRHILNLNAVLPAELPPLNNCPSSKSLLHTVPQDRSCEEACISEHWCTCNEFVSQSLTGEMYYLGKLIVFHINRWMLVNRYNKYCERILLQDMDYVEKKMLLEENGEDSLYGTIVTYRIGFHTYPGTGTFQTTVRFNRDLKTIEDFYVPDISRLNSYRNESICLNDNIGKKFCICYPNSTLTNFHKNWQNMKITTIAT